MLDWIDHALTTLTRQRDRMTAAIASLEALKHEKEQPAPNETEPPTRGTLRRIGKQIPGRRVTKRTFIGALRPKRALNPSNRAKPASATAERSPCVVQPVNPRASVVMFLTTHGPAVLADIIASTKLTAKQVGNALQRLKSSGQAFNTKDANGKPAWALVGTKKAIPAGKTPEFETIWNGSRERAGEAKNLTDLRG